MLLDPDVLAWSSHEFGQALLGDRRRLERLIAMGSQAAQAPAGKLTVVFPNKAQRRAAYRFLENEAINPQAICHSAHQAAARRCQGLPLVYIPVDESDLTVVDHTGIKRLGVVGTTERHVPGLQTLSGLAVAPDGTPLGILAQCFWARQIGPKKDRRTRLLQPIEEKETQYWLDAVRASRTVLAKEAPGVKPWYQMDRGADAWEVLTQAAQGDGWVTIRACWNRRVFGPPVAAQQYLWETVKASEVWGDFLLHVPPSRGRTERDAIVQIRACPVILKGRWAPRRRLRPLPIYAVLARELGQVPGAEDPIEWLLLTTYPVDALQAAYQVVWGYTQRWRVEDFHNTWKSGACEVEQTQLRDRDAIVRWAAILASVAMRILRLTYLSRNQPMAPASLELSQAEIDAAMVVAGPTGYRPGEVPSISEVAEWIADQGGYTGKSSGGPPGAHVLARGLKRLELLAKYFAEGENRCGQR